MDVYALGFLLLPALWAAGLVGTLGRLDTAWRMARMVASTACAAAAGQLLTAPNPAVQHVIALLVAVLGWVIVRYSHRYLAGEPGQIRYLRALLSTLASVSVVVVTDNLGVLVAAWFASSLGVHGLLTFYSNRRPALLAARKKFVVSRLADVALLVALALVWRETTTLDIPTLLQFVDAQGELSSGLQLAAVGFALGAILKSAQLPLHGWLIQVMEAPTPVSALLHAGVVNLGGFVLIRLAGLISAAPYAQALLVAVGGVTALAAGLVMATRISIKVRLAWSTCAQMGFLLLECGLGLYGFAVLHLVAHSLYKAHAFLSAGSAVLATRADIATPVPTFSAVVLAPLGSAAVVGGLVAALASWQPDAVPHWAAVGVFVFGTSPLWWQGFARGLVGVAGVALLALGLHGVFGALAPDVVSSPLLCALGVGLLGALYALQAWLTVSPGSPAAHWLHGQAFAGFHLDEPLSRWVLRQWPLATARTHVV